MALKCKTSQCCEQGLDSVTDDLIAANTSTPPASLQFQHHLLALVEDLLSNPAERVLGQSRWRIRLEVVHPDNFGRMRFVMIFSLARRPWKW